MLDEFAALTGLPVVVNTSLNTAGRPMVDDPRDALECFGSAPVDVLAIGPFLVRRPGRRPQERAREGPGGPARTEWVTYCSPAPRSEPSRRAKPT